MEDKLPILATSSATQKNHWHILSLSAFFLALLSLLGSAYFWKTFRNSDVARQQQLVSLDKQLQQQQNSITKQQLLLQHLTQLTQQADEKWLMTELEYLLRLANIQLQIIHDIPTTLKLLQTAKQRIETTKNSLLLKLRQALANDIATLQASVNSDPESVFIHLSALRQQLEKLSVIPLKITETPPVEGKANIANETLWHKAWRSSITTLQQIVVISNHDRNVPLLLNPEQEFYLRLEMNALISQAQLALLQNQTALYFDSLRRLKTLVQRFFSADPNAQQTALANMDSLLKIKINAKNFNLESLQVFKQQGAN